MVIKMIEVEIIMRATIKPFSPTPSHLKNHKLSFSDQVAPPWYVSIILFYPTHNKANDDSQTEIARKSQELQRSLSKTLTHFYPLAGRIKDNLTLACNDDGVDYMEACASVQMYHILQNPDIDVLNQFLPCALQSSKLSKGVLLAIQINKFTCGGTAICFSMSHKIGDASSLGTFVNAWAATARGANEGPSPSFESSVLFPPREISWFIPDRVAETENVVTRRFVFDAQEITALRAKAAENSRVEKPTRVEAVFSLIWKCATAVVSRKLKYVRPSMVNLVVNLRGRMVPPLPKHSFGNLIVGAIAEANEVEELHGSVGRLRDAIMQISADYVRELVVNEGLLRFHDSLKEAIERFFKGELELYTLTSWCRFPFYEADFGWGKPIWVGPANLIFRNGVVLMDTRCGDGLEAWVSMDEHEMAEFECDQDLCKFSSATHKSQVA